MATLQVLRTTYSDVARIRYADIPAADNTALVALANSVDTATLTLSQARAQVAAMVYNTTSVASLSYYFFVGVTPSTGGFDYLVSPTGGNSTNLNSSYYAAFSAENRYINFAVALGKGGAGAARFSAAYGGLDLAAATAKAYAEIFGFAPEAGKVDQLLTAVVPNGSGGTFTRADYFAAYGQDGTNGQGTKAAMVGWLLAEAAKSGIGVYAAANQAFLADLAADGEAAYNVDLLGVYGAQPVYPVGASITPAIDQSVSLGATAPELRATTGSDTITGVDSNAAQIISTGDGHDRITFTGGFAGYIDAGAGNDVINVAVLAASTPVQGGQPNGTISAGAGNDTITVGRMADGAVIDGGAGDDTATIAFNTDSVLNPRISNVEHVVITNATITFGGIPATGWTGLKDITVNSAATVTDIADGVSFELNNVSSGAVVANYHTDLVISGMSSTVVGAKSVEVRLAGVSNGGATPTTLAVGNDDGALILNVQSNSALSSITGGSSVIIKGVGRLTAGFSTFNLDASASAGVDITHIGSATVNNATVAVLSSGNDSVAADLRGQANSTYTLGAGADVFSLYQDGFAAPRFFNVTLDGGKVTTMAVITDFVKSVDTVNLGAVVPALVTNLTPGAATTVEQALANVSLQLAANGTAVFSYNGDTYIYHQDATVGLNTGDGLIKLVGVTNVSTGAGAAVADVHFG
jgi:hypothetical protein